MFSVTFRKLSLSLTFQLNNYELNLDACLDETNYSFNQLEAGF